MHKSSVYLLACIYIASTHGWSNSNSPKSFIISRRAWIAKSVAAASAVSTVTPAWAEEETISDNDKAVSKDSTREEVARIKKEQKEQADREKEARRMAEETKKRLAVGRIGTI
jgi:hypothetical protein